ncbi:sodium/glutamate symporter [Gordonibacter massiliensis (ex Traore et al. 2017)]|uniref:sodium/glutamate symporter n=1 Tax=Gordonibacter massiliensis (ex Traore et al. 2017) TaxID=1841863 RepID=UPI001C8C79B5|nr:sodium/glutamate symporter [Gordonibacter massiliensis (ex Traore et al. 2017)]MBX9033639.1 hypothetical protein [Gordonibacter massiliensis (ex Traore et al. 2017)]
MQLTDFLFDFCIMSALLLVAKVIRAKVGFLQRLYIPSALIAGFLGLFLGKQFLNIVPFSTAISDYAGVLIVVVFGSMYLGTKRKTSVGGMVKRVGDSFFVNGAAEIAQFGIFILLGCTLLPLVFPGINDAFGLMLPCGFAGGHGTAAAVGSVLSEAGWDDGVTVGQTFATIGLLGGIVFGVVLLNIGARRGYTRVVKGAADLPEEMLSGLNPEDKRGSIGSDTVNSISMDSLTWHVVLVLISTGAGYLLNAFLKIVIPQVAFPTYGLAILCGIVLQWALRLVKLDEYVDRKTITHICSCATDYLVAFGVASISVSIVMKYAAPIIFLAALGFAGAFLWQFLVCSRFLRNFWFERGLFIFGQSTGVLATGVLLLRVSDPNFKSGVLADFGLVWLFFSIVDALLVAFSPTFVLAGYGIPYAICITLAAVVFLLLSWKMFGVRKFNKAGGLETVKE